MKRVEQIDLQLALDIVGGQTLNQPCKKAIMCESRTWVLGEEIPVLLVSVAGVEEVSSLKKWWAREIDRK